MTLSIMGIVAAGIMKFFTDMGKSSSGLTVTRTAQQLRANVQMLVNSPSAWNKTVDKQATGALLCLAQKNAGDCRGAKGPLSLYAASGTLEVDSSPGKGYTMGGDDCTGYSDTGNNACPFRVDVEWEAICADPKASCSNPSVRISGAVRYRPAGSQRRPSFNESNYAFNIIRGQGPSSISEFCTSLGGTFDEDRQFCNIDNVICATMGGVLKPELHRCEVAIEALCPGGEAVQRIWIREGRLEVVCIPTSDDFDPFSFKLVPLAWGDAKMKLISQNDIQGCATTAASTGSDLGGTKCRQDRPAGASGTCYYRIPVVLGVTRNDLAGWYRVGSGYCRGGVFVNDATPIPP